MASNVDGIERDATSVDADDDAVLAPGLLKRVDAAVERRVLGVTARQRIEVLERAVADQLGAPSDLEEASRVRRVHQQQADARIGEQGVAAAGAAAWC